MSSNSMMRRIGTLAALLAMVGCSAGSLTGTSTKGPSQSQVNSFMQQIGTAYSNGMSAANPERAARELYPARFDAAGAAITPPGDPFAPKPMPFAGGLPPGISPTLVNVSVTQRTTCTSGGYINVTGSMTGSLDNNGTGVLQTQITETINNWQCIGGYVMDGAPYLSAAGTFSFINGNMGTAASIEFGGGFQWSGNGSGTCSVNMTAIFEPNGSGTLSGTACGYQVNVTY